LGAIHAGAIAVPVSELAMADDVREYVLHAGATIAISDAHHEEVLDAIRNETPDLRELICVGAKLAGSHDFQAIIDGAQPVQSGPLFDTMRDYKPTVLFATPSVYAQLAHDAEQDKRGKPLGALRCAVAGAEGMPERLIPRIRSVLGTEVVVGYGLTEIFQFAL